MKYSYSLFRFVLMTIAALVLVSSAIAQVKKPISKTGLAKSSATSSVKCVGNGLTDAEQADLLRQQNEMRAKLKLTPFSWDCTLANYAQEWANRGVFEHRADSNYGENMFVASAPAEPVGSAIVRWMSEEPNWTNKSGTCAAGKFCNHYTQLMWRSSKKVGCGINRNGAVKWKLVLVCNYDPAGNTPGPAY